VETALNAQRQQNHTVLHKFRALRCLRWACLRCRPPSSYRRRKRNTRITLTQAPTAPALHWQQHGPDMPLASNFAHQRPRILVHKNYCQTGAVGMWPPQYVKLPTFILTALLTCEIIALWRLISMVRSLTWSRLSSSPIFFLGFGRYALWHGPLNKRQAENELAAS
jgi:hypothetical protein